MTKEGKALSAFLLACMDGGLNGNVLKREMLAVFTAEAGNKPGTAKPQQSVVMLAQSLLKAAGKQDPERLMKALLMCMQVVDQVHNGLSDDLTPNV